MEVNFNESIYWLIKRSLYLDFRIFLIKYWSFAQKLEFIIKKYYLLFLHKAKPFVLGESKIVLFKNDLFYGTKFGLSDYQSMLTRQQRLLDVAKIKAPKTIIDIGANVGFFTRLVVDNFPKASVYSIEAVPQVADCLKKNTKTYKNVQVFNTAMSEESGEFFMNFNKDNSLVTDFDPKGNIRVKAVTLDEFCQANSIETIDILKIDVEHFEHLVLQGAQNTLKNVKYLVLEVTLEDNSNYTISSLLSLLYSKDFDFQLLAFRNYADVAEGKINLMDTVFINTKFE